MSIESVFSSICGRLRQAVRFHDEMIAYYDFLGYVGLSEVNKYQLFSEKNELVKVKQYYVKSYNSILKESAVDDTNYIPENWLTLNRFQLEGGEKIVYLKEGLETWAEWENSSKKFYENRYCDAFDLHEIDACRVIADLIKNVSEELLVADEMIVRIKGTGWDCARIDEMQDKLVKVYKEKILNIGKEIDYGSKLYTDQR